MKESNYYNRAAVKTFTSL